MLFQKFFPTKKTQKYGFVACWFHQFLSSKKKKKPWMITPSPPGVRKPDAELCSAGASWSGSCSWPGKTGQFPCPFTTSGLGKSTFDLKEIYVTKIYPENWTFGPEDRLRQFWFATDVPWRCSGPPWRTTPNRSPETFRKLMLRIEEYLRQLQLST